MVGDLTPASPKRQRPQLSEEATALVRTAILDGRLRPGDYIRPEQVAAQLEMSTTPAREGLLTLRGEGFLELVRRRGFVVLPLSGDDIFDLFTIRSLVAGELAERAVKRMDEPTLQALEGSARSTIAAVERGDLHTATHTTGEFYSHLKRVAESPKIEWFLDTLVRYVPLEFWSSVEGWPELIREFQPAFVKAAAAGDAELARSMMANHMQASGRLAAAKWETSQSSRASETA